MAKFNLKKILMNDYDIEIVQALNFEQWVNRNMDYQISYGKDVKEIFFKSERTNKKEFLKDIKRQASKLDRTKSIDAVLTILKEEDTIPQPASTEVYDKLRKSELENEELRRKITSLERENNTLKGDLKLMELKNLELFDIAELYAKVNDECVGFLKDFELGFGIDEYSKVAGRLVGARTKILKELLTKNGVPPIVVNKLVIDWRIAIVKNYQAEVIKSKDLRNYDKEREKVRKYFTFVSKNPGIIDLALNLQEVGYEIKKTN